MCGRLRAQELEMQFQAFSAFPSHFKKRGKSAEVDLIWANFVPDRLDFRCPPHVVQLGVALALQQVQTPTDLSRVSIRILAPNLEIKAGKTYFAPERVAINKAGPQSVFGAKFQIPKMAVCGN